MRLSARHIRPDYSPAERRSDAVIHVVGVAAALVSVPVLVLLAAQWHGTGAAVAATTIYGCALIAMLTFSAIYNMSRAPAWRRLLKSLDHSAIYFKIAGTYTPFALLTGQGAAFVAALWGAALAGAGLKTVNPDRWRWAGLALYLGMGWAGLFAGWAIFSALSPEVMALIVAGGLLYTVGTAFFLCHRLHYHNTIWHGFVLVASVVFYCAVLLQVIQTARSLVPDIT